MRDGEIIVIGLYNTIIQYFAGFVKPPRQIVTIM